MRENYHQNTMKNLSIFVNIEDKQFKIECSVIENTLVN